MDEAMPLPRRLIPQPHHRITAKDQVDELKEPFARLYPCGLPKEYKMCGAPIDEVPVKYIEDNLPLGFYTNPPVGAKAIFSTSNGQRAFRPMHHILPRRRLHLWSKNEIQENCNSIRRLHWEAMRGMTEPNCWDDLWKYFDAFDLYSHGAINLWNIINHLYAENRIIKADVSKNSALELGRWSQQWLQVKDNAEKLKRWDISKCSVLKLFDAADRDSLGCLSDADVSILANALSCRRGHLLSPTRTETTEPRSLLSSLESECGVENWMTGQVIHRKGGLQQSKPEEVINSDKHAYHPCIVFDGRHYYDPRPRSKGAVEALKASVEAASGHIIVANGSQVSPPRHHQVNQAVAKKDSVAVKPVASDSRQTRPSSSDGSLAMPTCSRATSQSGSPRRMSDSTIRPSNPPSPDMGQTLAFVPTGGAPSGSRRSPEKSVGNDQSKPQRGAASNTSGTPPRQAGEIGSKRHLIHFAHANKEPLSATSFSGAGLENKIGSPRRGRRADSYSSQHTSSPSSRPQFGGFSPGAKQFSQKWSNNFRRQDNFGPIYDTMQYFPNTGMRRNDTLLHAGDGQDCPNVGVNLDRSSYLPCGCFQCAMRNRSIWVRVADKQNLPLMDVQTRVRYGVESRFGRVEDVNHAPGQGKPESMNFIVRFVSEDSVPQALVYGRGRIDEKGIKINMSAMFRSKWVLQPSAFQTSSRIAPPESIHQVYKAPSQRRGDLSLTPDFFMGSGGSSAQKTSGGPFMHSNRSFGQIESRNFGQSGPYFGKKPRFPVNADGNSQWPQQQPFHTFHPQAQYHNLPVEAANKQSAVSMLAPTQAEKLDQAQQDTPAPSAVDCAISGVEGAIQSVPSPEESAKCRETAKPRVSLPERLEVPSSTVSGRCYPKKTTDEPVAAAPVVAPRADQSPVRHSKKKRQAAQLQTGAFEGTEPTAATSGGNIASAITAAAAAPASKEKEHRRPSLFTPDEIRDRKQAWDRIVVPLISPRKQILAIAGPARRLPAKPGHDRAKSLPVTILAPSKTTAAANSSDEDQSRATVSAQKEVFLEAPQYVVSDGKSGSDAGHPGAAPSAPPSTSPKKSSKAARKKRNKQDAQFKGPAKKEHKL
ncbi:hypothetical protein ISF_01169 [Cordyceps fumosorosea ARSEF 2679]|uniref:Uncharacterized protein n=1 Tax=Cordyceps fumosorosea (strain ARSEF 2679) TaxID=1081104 RepID=A0A168D2Q2_CORFA|nr:hypothetical protein ISF_01169 [Cordyceps fumosorosea ARSEF 2679]OAA72096.1 hypothetical protein ISF_01169 [Cordyceps fumosorosea ARSEF 2679]